MKTRAKAKTPVTVRTLPPARTRITATEAARKFSEILNRVAYKNETFVVERNGHPVCEISPPAKKGISTQKLVEVLSSGPRADKGYFKILEKITRNQPPVAPSP